MSPAVSESQQKLMAIALKIKRGEAPKSYSPQAAEIAETMSESDLEDFASKMEKSERKERLKKVFPLVPILVGAGGALAGKKIAETVLSDDNDEKTVELRKFNPAHIAAIAAHTASQSKKLPKPSSSQGMKWSEDNDEQAMELSAKNQKTKKGVKKIAATGLGAGIGAAAGGPVGAALGGVAGHTVGEAIDKPKVEKNALSKKEVKKINKSDIELSNKNQKVKKLGPIAIAGLAGLAGGAGIAAGKKIISNQEEKSCDKETVKKIAPLVASGGRALLGYAAGKAGKKIDQKVNKKIGLNKGGPGSGKKKDFSSNERSRLRSINRQLSSLSQRGIRPGETPEGSKLLDESRKLSSKKFRTMNKSKN